MSWLDKALRVLALGAALVCLVAVTHAQAPQVPELSVQGPTAANATVPRADAVPQAYEFLLQDPDHQFPARWCSNTIGFQLDTTLLAEAGLDPTTELRRWQAVFAGWSEASNYRYRFEYRGESELLMDSNGEPDIAAIPPGTIGIVYVHGRSASGPTEYRSRAVAGRTAGNGGLQAVSSGNSDASALIADRGFVLIDAYDAGELEAGSLRRALYQHESGHALGLGHVEDRGALMHDTLSMVRLQISSGDAAGLRELASMPCSS